MFAGLVVFSDTSPASTAALGSPEEVLCGSGFALFGAEAGAGEGAPFEILVPVRGCTRCLSESRRGVPERKDRVVLSFEGGAGAALFCERP